MESSETHFPMIPPFVCSWWAIHQGSFVPSKHLFLLGSHTGYHHKALSLSCQLLGFQLCPALHWFIPRCSHSCCLWSFLWGVIHSQWVPISDQLSISSCSLSYFKCFCPAFQIAFLLNWFWKDELAHSIFQYYSYSKYDLSAGSQWGY